MTVANHFAFQSVGEALRVFLQSSYPEELSEDYECTFEVLSSGSLADYKDPTSNTVAVTLYLYRVSISPELRNQYQPGRQPPGRVAGLPVELHWMVSVWSSSSEAEQVVFAWVLSQLNQHTLLDDTVLPAAAGWAPGDLVHVLPEEMPMDQVMRIWEALEPSYRLSFCYVARVVPLEAPVKTLKPAVAARFDLDRDVR